MGKPAIPDPPQMTSDEFIAWAIEQPKRPRYELVAGELVLMAPERAAHARVKAAVWRALDEVLRAARLPCEAYPDGMAVKVDDSVVYEPDALVRCGEPLLDDAVKVTDPMIVVEVLSPSTGHIDTGSKLEGYFGLPSLRHYLVVDTVKRFVLHYCRSEEGAHAVRVLRDGILALDPPGIEIEVRDLFGAER